MDHTLTIEFWEVSSGSSPVVDYLESMPVKAREKARYIITLLKRRGTALMGTTKFMKKLKGVDLYELRIKWQNTLYRILFIIVKSVACLLHMFQKRGEHTPMREINIALARAKLHLATTQ